MNKSNDFAGSLSEPLRSIVGEAITCELGLPTPPEGKPLNLDAVNVVCTTSAGWRGLHEQRKHEHTTFARRSNAAGRALRMVGRNS